MLHYMILFRSCQLPQHKTRTHDTSGFVLFLLLEQDQGDQQADPDGAQRPAAPLLGLFLGFLLQRQGFLVSSGLAGGLTEFLLS